jgi:glutamine synthetase
MLHVISRQEIERLTFHYTAFDGKLKELQLPISTLAGAERLLAEGERVDGSSLFAGVVDSGASDLYVVPVYRSAFVNPFDPHSLDFVCRFFDRHGVPAPFAPDNILHRAAAQLTKHTGLSLRALGELEFYLLSENSTSLYPSQPQRGYHANAPFVKSGEAINEMLRYLEQITGAVKYGHGEVGWIGSVESDCPELSGKTAEQFEIEFLPLAIEDCADALVIARWLIREVAYRHRLLATFTPKLQEGVAGNGLHIHLELTRHDRNVMTSPEASLSKEALMLIGGLCNHADVLTAFGNTMASSYLRLVPDQEAPTRICWSDMNRSALIRVPLAWNVAASMSDQLNPPSEPLPPLPRQTVELRTPDGSAHVHLLLAAITAVADRAFQEPGSVELARKRYTTAAGLRDEAFAATLPSLPSSCAQAAELLENGRGFFEAEQLFPDAVLKQVIRELRSEDDAHLSRTLHELGPEQRPVFLRGMMHRDLHRH